MTAPALARARSFAFGSADLGSWGIAWVGDGGGHVAWGRGDEVTVDEFALDAGVEVWTAHGAGVELTLTPTSPAGAGNQLCRVEGALSGHEVEAPGWRWLGSPQAADRPLDSFRQLAAWFGPGDGLALLAVRPRGAKGHEGDVIRAVLFEAEAAVEVEDPRLSTTYDGEGRAERAGLELWLGDPEEQQHSHRASGEAAGDTAEFSAAGLALSARPFRWHTAGRAGGGVYLMGHAT